MTPEFPFFRGRRVLVTGGAGLIGSAFVERLLVEGASVRTVRHARDVPFPEVETVPGDLTRPDDCLKACAGMDTVVHAAGVSGGSKKVSTQLIPMFTDNLAMGVQMLEGARLSGVERYLFISNSSVYGKSELPLREEDAWGGESIPAPENETGYVKRIGETQCAIYARFATMKIAIMRSGNAFGPRDNFDLETSHVLPALIHKAVAGLTPFPLWGSGENVRDFIQSSDIARGGLFLLERAGEGAAAPINVSSGRGVSMLELARIVLTAAGRPDTPIQLQPDAPRVPNAKRIDVSKMKALGFAPLLSLEQGVSQTVDWFRNFKR
jgi:GDP-L-fucose synthase